MKAARESRPRSSATLAWIYSEEMTDAIRAVFDQVADAGAVVPALWRLEVANSLTVAVRRNRIDAEFRRAPLPIWRCWTSPRTSILTAKPGLRHYSWPIATDSPFMTRPIWNLRGAENCRLPRWIRNFSRRPNASVKAP
jgi:hypothetical protein